MVIWGCLRAMTGARSFPVGLCCRLTALFCRNECVAYTHAHAPISITILTSVSLPIVGDPRCSHRWFGCVKRAKCREQGMAGGLLLLLVLHNSRTIPNPKPISSISRHIRY